jgi:hypothetical protein
MAAGRAYLRRPRNVRNRGAARRSAAVTCTGVQMPQRAVATPRALRALAIARNVTGTTLAAKRSRSPCWRRCRAVALA